MQLRIVCAAARNETTGLIICSPRHYDKTFHNVIKNLSENWTNRDEITQGFIDQKGNFLTREAALIIANENNQIIRRCGGDDLRLFSENLY